MIWAFFSRSFFTGAFVKQAVSLIVRKQNRCWQGLRKKRGNYQSANLFFHILNKCNSKARENSPSVAPPQSKGEILRTLCAQTPAREVFLIAARFYLGEAGFKGRVMSTGHGACRNTRSAFEPKSARIENPAPCTPMQIKSMLCSSAYVRISR